MGVLTGTLLVVIVLLMSLLVTITVLFLRALDKTLKHADLIHVRSQVHVDHILDRFMALDFQQFKSWQSTEGLVGGQEIPEPPPEPSVSQEVHRDWGFRGYGDSGEPEDEGDDE